MSIGRSGLGLEKGDGGRGQERRIHGSVHGGGGEEGSSPKMLRNVREHAVTIKRG